MPKLMETVKKMGAHVDYLKKSKKLVTHLDTQAGSYTTFYQENGPKYRNTGLVFNNGTLGMARFFNPMLALGNGVNDFVMAKNSVLNFPNLKTLVQEAKKVFDAALASFPKRKEYISMTFFILYKFTVMEENQFKATLDNDKILQARINAFFNEGLEQIPDWERITISSQLRRFKALVNMSKETLAIVRNTAIQLKKMLNVYKEEYHVGE